MIYKAKVPEKYLWSLEIDFSTDFERIAYSEILTRGHTPTSLKDAPLELFRILKHDIKSVPRKVEKSDCFACPAGYEIALQEFEEKVKNGESLWPFTTEKYDEVVGYNDLLLNDWNIFHFHLTRRYKSNGKAARSNWLIMAILTNDTAYLIQVYNHVNLDCFNDINLLEIVNRNWPALLQNNRVIGVPETKLTNEDVAKLRKAHINGSIQLSDGSVIQSLGGGITTDGGSLDSLIHKIDLQHKLLRYEKVIIDNMSRVIEAFITASGKLPILDMKIVLCSINKDGFECTEVNNDFLLIKSDSSFVLNYTNG